MNPNKPSPEGPEKNIIVGAVRATIWKHTRKTRDGRSFTARKIVVDRSYRDSMGQWQNTHNLEINDIPKAILALEKSYDYLHEVAHEESADEVMVEEVSI